jgi:two-component system OmpR family response regulator
MTQVLIVDDDPQLRRVMCRLLERELIECDAVSSIAEARSAMVANAPALMILDIVVGNDSGIALYEEMVGMNTALPTVILITGRRDLFKQLSAILRPGDDWVIKPWDPAEVVARVSLALRRRESRSPKSDAER